MSAIPNQWTGAGLADGDTINAANVNAAGNGSAVVYNGSGTATMVKEANGFRVTSAESATARRIDAAISGQYALAQARVKIDAFPVGGSLGLVQVRNASALVRELVVTSEGVVGAIGSGLTGAARSGTSISLGDELLVVLIAAQSATPTASNGRLVFSVRNLTNPAWEEDGELFFDSGYTLDLGTVPFTQIRFGKMTTHTLPAPGALWQFPGWDTPTINPAHTSEAQIRAYFPDVPVVQAPPTSGNATPLPGSGSGASGWTVIGSAASEGEALADNNAATAVQSPELSSTASERIFRLQSMTPRGQLTLTLTGVVAGSANCQARVYSGTALVATKAIPASTSASTVTVQLAAAETAAITNWGDVRVGLRAVL